MKKLLFLLLVCSSYAQDKFELTPAGFTDYVVTNVDGNQSEIYQKSINWIKETYKNPDHVIKMTMENEKIRIEGFQENFYCVKSMGMNACSNMVYSIEISFKDGKYKFDPTSVHMSNSTGNKAELKLNDMGSIYFKNGKPNKGYEDFILNFQNHFNSLNQSLKDYITGASKSNNDW